MTAPFRLALALATGMVAACAGPIEDSRRAPPPGPDGPGVTVLIAASGQAGHRFAEEVAARCLLDGVVGGAAMVVDRQTGRIVIAGDREELLAIDVIPAARGSRLRLSGPTVENQATRERILYELDRAARTGDTACPILRA